MSRIISCSVIASALQTSTKRPIPQYGNPVSELHHLA